MTRRGVPALVGLALDYYRDPLVFRHLSEMQRPLPDGFDALLTDFCAALSLSRLKTTAKRLGVEPTELEAAARFLVRHVLLDPAGDYYRHLGLNRDASADAIRHHYQLLIRQFHPDRVDTSTEAGAFYATRINLAYRTLRQAEARARYNAGLPPYPGGRTETDAAWFFSPNRPMPPGSPGAEHAYRRRWRLGVGGWVVGGIGVVMILLSLAFVLLRTSQAPTLRLASATRGERLAPLPHYLSGAKTSEQVAVPGGASMVPAVEAAAQLRETVAPHVSRPTTPVTGVTVTRRAPVAALPPEEPALTLRDAVSPEPVVAGSAPSESSESPSRRPETAPALLAMPGPVGNGVVLKQSARGAKELDPQRGPPPVVVVARAEPSPTVAEKREQAARNEAERKRAERERAERAKAERDKVERARAAALMSRLESAYRTENATAFAALFTADAQVNEGSGRELIRRRYADLFERAEASELSIDVLRLQSMPSGRLLGTGRISVRNRYSGSRDWRRVDGRVEFELVRVGSEYRIARMIDYLD